MPWGAPQPACCRARRYKGQFRSNVAILRFDDFEGKDAIQLAQIAGPLTHTFEGSDVAGMSRVPL